MSCRKEVLDFGIDGTAKVIDQRAHGKKGER